MFHLIHHNFGWRKKIRNTWCIWIINGNYLTFLHAPGTLQVYFYLSFKSTFSNHQVISWVLFHNHKCQKYILYLEMWKNINNKKCAECFDIFYFLVSSFQKLILTRFSKVFLLLCTGKRQKIKGLKQKSDIHLCAFSDLHEDTNLEISRYLTVWTPRDINFVPETYFQTTDVKQLHIRHILPTADNRLNIDWKMVIVTNIFFESLVFWISLASWQTYFSSVTWHWKHPDWDWKVTRTAAVFPISIRKPLVPVKRFKVNHILTD